MYLQLIPLLWIPDSCPAPSVASPHGRPVASQVYLTSESSPSCFLLLPLALLPGLMPTLFECSSQKPALSLILLSLLPDGQSTQMFPRSGHYSQPASHPISSLSYEPLTWITAFISLLVFLLLSLPPFSLYGYKVNRIQKAHVMWFHLNEMSGICKAIESKSRWVITRGWRGVTANGYAVSLLGDEVALELEVIMVAQPCDYTINHWIVRFRRVDFMICDLYLNSLRSQITLIL